MIKLQGNSSDAKVIGSSRDRGRKQVNKLLPDVEMTSKGTIFIQKMKKRKMEEYDPARIDVKQGI